MAVALTDAASHSVLLRASALTTKPRVLRDYLPGHPAGNSFSVTSVQSYKVLMVLTVVWMWGSQIAAKPSTQSHTAVNAWGTRLDGTS